MAGTRIQAARPVPVKDNDLDRVQRSLATAMRAITASPTLDSQMVTAPLNSTTAAQTLTFTHQLGRVPTGLHIVSCSALITASGQQAFTSTTASITIQTSTASSGSVIAVVF